MSPFRAALAGLVPALAVLGAACVPPGNATPSDAGASPAATASAATPAFRPSPNVMTAPFEDNFDRPATPAGDAAVAIEFPGDAGTDARLPRGGPLLGPNWMQAGTDVWHIENGRLCGDHAHNHGVWLERTLPVNARIEFDAISEDPDGDLKAEVWGDGRSAATSISYTNATSYLTIFGGWHNKFHVLARINEHGTDRKQIVVQKDSDDPTQQPVTAGQVYHFKIERTDGKTVKWYVNGVEYLAYPDPNPLAGWGHDHFGFNDWEAKVCFDNVKVTPLP